MRRFVLFFMVLLLLGMVAAGLFFLLRDTEEKRVRKSLDRVCRLVEYRAGENPAAAALRISRADEIFSDPVLLQFRHDHFEDRAFTPREITRLLAAAQRALARMELRFSDVKIHVEGDRADVFFTAAFSGISRSGNGGRISEIRDINGVLQKRSGRWMVCELRVHEVLER